MPNKKSSLPPTFSSIIIRPRGIFGEYDTAVLPRLLKISEKGFLPLIRRSGREAGGALVDVTYVGNVVHALMLAAEIDAGRGNVYQLADMVLPHRR